MRLLCMFYAAALLLNVVIGAGVAGALSIDVCLSGSCMHLGGRQ